MDYIIYGLAKLLYNQRGRDAKLFTKRPAFADFPEPTIDVTSPDCGPSNSTLKVEYTQYGADRFPELEWTPPPAIAAAGKVKEYLLVNEDPDAPIPNPPVHCLFFKIPPTTTRITHEDAMLDREKCGAKGKKFVLKGGFRASKTILGKHYGGPRPPVGHGPHRYFYEVVALKEPLEGLSEMPTRKEVSDAIVGKVLGWGVWVGVFEKVWG
jgi:phosphatidylethanolamine-binding protein (PEBP) family uncharacterized protein